MLGLRFLARRSVTVFKVPTLMAQLRRDFLINAERDGQAIFDALGGQEEAFLGRRIEPALLRV
jgi:hypothetical protein